MIEANAGIEIRSTRAKVGAFAFVLSLTVAIGTNPAFAQQTDNSMAYNQPGVSYQQQDNRADNNPNQPGVSYQAMPYGGRRGRKNNSQQQDNRADNNPYQFGASLPPGTLYAGAPNGGDANGGEPDNRADNNPYQAGASLPPGLLYGAGPNGGGANGGEPPMRADNNPDQAGLGLPSGIPYMGGPSGGPPHRPFNPLAPHGPAIPKPGYDTSWSFPPAPPKPQPVSAPPPAPTPPPALIPGTPTTTLRNPYINGEQVTPANQAPALGQPEVPGNGNDWVGVTPGMGGGPTVPPSAVYIPPMGPYDKDAINAMVAPYLTPPAPTPEYDPGMLPGPGGLQNPGPIPPAAIVPINPDGDPTLPYDAAPTTRWSAQTTRDLGYPHVSGSLLTDFGQNPSTLSGVQWSNSQDGPRPFVFPGQLNATTNRNPNLAGAQVTQDLNGNRTLFRGPAQNERAQMTVIPVPPATH
jgi:hypothetical protein